MIKQDDIYSRVVKILNSKDYKFPNADIFQKNNEKINSEKLSIPLGISNHHIHLSINDLETLFGKNYKLTPKKYLGQPGQFACEETVTICGPRGALEKLRILGPIRDKTQVELLYSDCIKLGIKPSVRMSGDIKGTDGATIVGKCGSIKLNEGVIVAKRHIHMLPEEAKLFDVTDGEKVKIEFNSIRGNTLDDIVIRVSDTAGLECHIDIEEANAFAINAKTKIKILKY